MYNSRDFRYHLLSIGVNREANGASVRSAERDAFAISWTFAQLGYWRAERNRCLTGAQSTPQAIDAHLSSCASLHDLDLVMVFWSGHLFHDTEVVETLAAVPDARLRVLIVDTCHADDRLKRIGIQVTASPVNPSCSAMAYAVALSKPLPVVGSPHSGSHGSELPPSRPS